MDPYMKHTTGQTCAETWNNHIFRHVPIASETNHALLSCQAHYTCCRYLTIMDKVLPWILSDCYLQTMGTTASSDHRGYGYTCGFRAGFSHGYGYGYRNFYPHKPVPVAGTHHICICLVPFLNFAHTHQLSLLNLNLNLKIK